MHGREKNYEAILEETCSVLLFSVKETLRKKSLFKSKRIIDFTSVSIKIYL